MHTDTVTQINGPRRSSPAPHGAGLDLGFTPKRGPVRRLTQWARFADGCGLAELEVDSATGEIVHFYYRIDTARTGTLEFVSREPSSDVTSLFLTAALTVSRGMHRNFPGETAACRSVLHLVSTLETRCAQALRQLAPTAGRDRSAMH